MITLTLIQKITIWVLPILFAVSIHEYAHGWMADKLGDGSPRLFGRLTANPIKHIDLMGTIIIPLTLLAFGGFVFGWAKPVPINPMNFKNPKRDLALVSAAGPLSNLLMAFIWGAIMKLGIVIQNNGYPEALPIFLMGQAGVLLNIVLMILNLIPIPPLDGSRILAAFLPQKMLNSYARIEQYGMFILLLLIMSNILNFIITPIFMFIQKLILSVFGII